MAIKKNTSKKSISKKTPKKASQKMLKASAQKAKIEKTSPKEAPLSRSSSAKNKRPKESSQKTTQSQSGKVQKKKVITPEIVGVDTKLPVKSSSDLVSIDPLTKYLNEIKKYPLLTAEEEKALAIRYHEKGDPIAAEKLVTSNLRFVVKIALEYAKMGAKLMDVIQEGNVGLMHAVKEYNPYKGVKLITYAVWWIRGYIREYLLKQFSMVRIGTTQNQRKLFYNLEQEKRKLIAEGQDVSNALISSRLGVPERDIELMEKRLINKDVSLETPLDEDGNTTLLDTQTDFKNPEDELAVLELIDILKEKIEEIRPKLNEKELDILENRILSEEPQTLQEIGDRYGISRERARQLEERLLKNLKDNFLAIASQSIQDKLFQEQDKK